MEPDQQRSETETSKRRPEAEFNEVTKIPTKIKNPKRVAAGKRLAKLNKKKKESMKKVGVAPTVNPSNATPTEESGGVSALYKGP